MDKNSYHFGGMDDWIADAIHSGVDAETIHKEVIGSVRRQVKHLKTCYKTSKKLHELFSNRQYFDVVGDDAEILNDKINATSSYNDGWTQQYYKDKLKARGITTEINIAVPNHPGYTELPDSDD